MSVAEVIETSRYRFCNFCGGGEESREFLIQAVTDIRICEQCVEACAAMIAEKRAAKANSNPAPGTAEKQAKPTQ